MIPDVHRLPYIEGDIRKRSSRKPFTMFDLRNRFHQMPLHKGKREVTAMATPLETVQWTVFPVGFRNAPQMF